MSCQRVSRKDSKRAGSKGKNTVGREGISKKAAAHAKTLTSHLVQSTSLIGNRQALGGALPFPYELSHVDHDPRTCFCCLGGNRRAFCAHQRVGCADYIIVPGRGTGASRRARTHLSHRRFRAREA